MVLNTLFLSNMPNESSYSSKPKDLFVSDAFTNAAHVHFALKVTLAAMFCTSFIWLLLVRNPHRIDHLHFHCPGTHRCNAAQGYPQDRRLRYRRSTRAVHHRLPHAAYGDRPSLVVVVACASAIAGWVATGSEMISYAGLQIAFIFSTASSRGMRPTRLDNVRNRVVGILFGVIVTGLVFRYIWPEHTIDRLRDALRQAFRQLARLLEIPRPDTSVEKAKTEAHALIPETSKSFDQARRYIDLTEFEFEESPDRERTSLGNLEGTLSRAENVFVAATSLANDQAWNEWQQLPAAAKLRRASYEASLRSELSAWPLAMSSRMSALISQPLSLDGPKRCKRCR